MSQRVTYLLLALLSFSFGVIAMDIAQMHRDEGRICVPTDHDHAREIDEPRSAAPRGGRP